MPGGFYNVTGRLCLYVEAVVVHDLGPGSDKVLHELLAVIVLGVHLCVGTQDGVGAEHQVYAACGPLGLVGLAVTDLVGFVTHRFPAVGHVGQVHEEIIRELAFTVCEHTVLGATVVGAQYTHTTDQNGHLRCSQTHQLGAVEQQLFRLHDVVFLLPVTEAIGYRFQVLERRRIGHLVGRVATALQEGHANIVTGRFRSFLDTHATSQYDHIGHTGTGFGRNLLVHFQHLAQTGWLVAFPVFLRSQADTGAVGTTAHIRATEGTGAVPGSADHFADAQAAGSNLLFDHFFTVVGAACRYRILPDQVFCRRFRADITALRAQITVSQLEPGTGKAIFEVFRVCHELLADCTVLRIHLHGHVGIGHDRIVALGRITGVQRLILFLDIDWLPLPGTSRALLQLPFVAEQKVKVPHIELGRMGCPGAFNTGSHSIGSLTLHVRVAPAKALLFYISCFRLGAKGTGVTVTVTLTNRVATGRQGCSFFIVHRHAGEGYAYLLTGFDRIRLAVHAFRVYIDQAHLNRGKRVFHGVWLFYVAVTLIRRCQPLFLVTPVDVFFRVPDVLTAEGEAVRRQPHRLIGYGTGQDNQVSPAQFVAVLFLDRPQQTAGLVEADVIGPGVQWSEALVTGTTATTAVLDTVSTGSVPGHTNHQAAIVAPVCRPPVLAIGHQCVQVFLDGFEIELFDFFTVIEVFTQRIGFTVMLMQDVKVQRLRPPIHDIAVFGGVGTMHYRTLTTRRIVRHSTLLFSSFRHSVFLIRAPLNIDHSRLPA